MLSRSRAHTITSYCTHLDLLDKKYNNGSSYIETEPRCLMSNMFAF